MKPPKPSSPYRAYMEKFQTSIKLHLGQIPYILWYPIASVLALLYAVCHTVYHTLGDRVRKTVLDQKRLVSLTRGAVRTVLGSSGEGRSPQGNVRVCRVFTALLQLLSAITTYAGFSYYLSPISPLAPLLLAIVVQGLCYYLLNFTASGRQKGRGLRALLLAAVLFLSSLTSFIGISNVVQNPVEDMKNQYSSYRQAHNEMLSGLIQKPQTQEGSIRQLLTQADTLLSRGERTLASRKSMRSSMNPNQVTQSVDAEGKRTTRRSQDSGILGQITSETDRINLLENQISTLKTALSPLNAQGLEEAAKRISAFYTGIYSDAASTDIPAPSKDYLDFLACLGAANSLQGALDTLSGAKGGGDPFGVAAYTVPLEEISAWRSLKLPAFETLREEAVASSLSGEGKTLFTRFNRLIIPPDTTGAQAVYDRLKKEMDDKFHELYPSLNARDPKSAALLSAQFANSSLPSPQLLPLRYLLTSAGNHSRGLSFFSLGLAVLTDALSLLMALALAKRRDSLLNSGQAQKPREELLEDCCTQICLSRILRQPPSRKQGGLQTKKSVESYVCRELLSLLREFFGKIQLEHLPPKLHSFGYINREVLAEFTQDEHNLFQTLLNSQMIHPVAQFELLRLLRDEFSQGGAPLEDAYRARFREDEVAYLVDKKFLAWYNEAFSNLLGGGAADLELLALPTREGLRSNDHDALKEDLL